MKTLFSAVIASTTLLSGAAFAQNYYAEAPRADNWPNWYIGVHGELNYVTDSDIESGGGSSEIEYDTGWAAGISLGYRPYVSNTVLDNMRIEAEYTRRDAGFNNVSAPGLGSASLPGDLEIDAYMMNLYYDIKSNSRWTPYLGGGIGWADVEFASNAIPTSSDSVFAYQGMVGLNYEPESMPHTAWGLGYRFFSMSDPEYTTNTGGTLEHDYMSHGIEASAQFRF